MARVTELEQCNTHAHMHARAGMQCVPCARGHAHAGVEQRQCRVACKNFANSCHFLIQLSYIWRTAALCMRTYRRGPWAGLLEIFFFVRRWPQRFHLQVARCARAVQEGLAISSFDGSLIFGGLHHCLMRRSFRVSVSFWGWLKQSAFRPPSLSDEMVVEGLFILSVTGCKEQL